MTNKKICDWSLEKEREFIEHIVCQRFNFLLVLFGLIIAGAMAAKNQYYFQIVLWLGAITISPVSLTIIGVQWKLDWILKKIFEDKNHPITLVSAAGGHKSVRWMIGYFIPIFYTLSILFGAVLASCGILEIPK